MPSFLMNMQRPSMKLNTVAPYIILLVLAVLLSYLTNSSAPNHSFLFSPDANAFYMDGKCLAHGYVPYIDFIDTKGPFLFFIYMVGYLITPDSTFGVYVLSSLAMAVSFVQILRVCRCFGLSDWSVFGCLGLMLICLFDYNGYGGRCENFVLPFFTWLYAEVVLWFFCESVRTRLCQLGISMGVTLGFVLQMKWNYAVVPFSALCLAVCIAALRRDFVYVFLRLVLLTLGVCSIVIVPYIIYSACTSSWNAMVDIYINLSFQTSKRLSGQYYNLMGVNIPGLIMQKQKLLRGEYVLLVRFALLAGSLFFLCKKFGKGKYRFIWHEWILLVGFFLMVPLSCYFGPFHYYMVAASTFDIMTAVAVFVLLKNHCRLAVVIALVSYGVFFHQEKYLTPMERNIRNQKILLADLSAYAELLRTMRKNEGARILYYDGLAYGFEVETGLMPACPTWFRLNDSGEKYVRLSDRALDNKQGDFVVVRRISDSLGQRLEKLGYIMIGEYLDGENLFPFSVWKRAELL